MFTVYTILRDTLSNYVQLTIVYIELDYKYWIELNLIILWFNIYIRIKRVVTSARIDISTKYNQLQISNYSDSKANQYSIQNLIEIEITDKFER